MKKKRKNEKMKKREPSLLSATAGVTVCSLYRPARGGLLPKGQLEERFNQFMTGQWTQLLIATRDCSEQACRRRTQVDTIERRAQRVETVLQLGELSAGRHALVGALLAPGNDETRRALTDERRRPPKLRAPSSEDLIFSQPVSLAFEPRSASEELEVRQTWRGWRAIRDDSRTSAPSA